MTKRFLGTALLAWLTSCAGAPSGGHDDESGALQGQLAVISVLGSEAASTRYFLRIDGGSEEIRLIFDADPKLPGRTPIRVWGIEEDGALRVSRHAVVSPAAEEVGTTRAPLIGAPSTTRTVAWVQMNVNNEGVNQTKADAERLIFNENPGPLFGSRQGDKSVSQYYDENSYGMLKLTGAVEGPIPFNGTACNNFNPLAREMEEAIADMGRTYDHYYLFWGSEQDCGPGWGAQGEWNDPGSYVWLNNNGTFCAALGQELGHNFGLMHASTMDCGSSTLANNTSSGCSSSEYGNRVTVMGGGCRHLIAIEKWYAGFFGECNAIRVRSSATFTLLPIEIPCNGIQALQIPFPSNAPERTTSTDQSNGSVTISHYYLELRGGRGIDTGLAPGVYVHVAGDVPAPDRNGPRTFQLDMNPATNGFDPMSAGQTFQDPAGNVSFTVESFDTNSATVTVTMQDTGTNTCLDGSTLSGTGPATCDGPPTGSGGGSGAGGAPGTGGSGGGGAGGSGLAGGDGAGGLGTGGSSGVNGGAAGVGGTAGAGGSPQTAGAPGSAGSTGFVPGNAGSPGTGGVAGVAGASSGPPRGDPLSPAGTKPSEVVGGCACDLSRASNGDDVSGFALLCAALGMTVARRRKSSDR